MLKFLVSLSLWSSVFYSFGQVVDTTYINEASLIISGEEFAKKEKSNLYYSFSYPSDTIIYRKVFLKYFIGKLEKDKKNQLFNLLSQRNNIDTTKSILIHYKDTLKSKSSFPSRDKVVKYKDGSHRHIISHRTFIRQHKVCEKKYSSDNIKMYHFFNFNEGHPKTINKLEWHQDPLRVLRRMFYNHSDNIKYWTLLIHPNGDYAINNGGIRNQRVWKELKAHKNWKNHKKKFYNSYYALNPELREK